MSSISMLKSSGIMIRKDIATGEVRVDNPTQNLESYFLEVVEKAKREEETLSAIERLTGNPFGASQKEELAKGPNEIDLVRSGLEETMIEAYHEILKTLLDSSRKSLDTRLAAYVVAISKVALSYESLGIFP